MRGSITTGSAPAHNASEIRAVNPSISVPTNTEERRELKPRWDKEPRALKIMVREDTAVTNLFAPALALLSSVSWAVKARVEKRKRRAQALKRPRSLLLEEADASEEEVGMLKVSPAVDEERVDSTS